MKGRARMTDTRAGQYGNESCLLKDARSQRQAQSQQPTACCGDHRPYILVNFVFQNIFKNIFQ